uniref:Uncharacterized protein n=1 Tax=Amphiprion ocellaris TaxID=80972 RepID=A0A3Q1B0S4_AMPOC
MCVFFVFFLNQRHHKCKCVTIGFAQLVLLPCPNTLKQESKFAGTRHFFNRFLHTPPQSAAELRAMNPQGYPSASAPLQGVQYGQPEGPGMVQYTTVNVVAEPPKDHIIWSIFSFVHMNPCCLGLAALIHSVKYSLVVPGQRPEDGWRSGRGPTLWFHCSFPQHRRHRPDLPHCPDFHYCIQRDCWTDQFFHSQKFQL